MYTLGIATRGFITDSETLTLTIGTKGFLYTVPSVVIPEEIFKRKKGNTSSVELDKYKEIESILQREDDEVLLIIKLFLKCQN